MGSTTIRVDIKTHASLASLADESGASLMDTVRDAAEALRRQRFARRVVEEVTALRSDPAAWDQYLAAAETSSVRDGVG
jgi:hypothetical protein